jgi:hypothetical protein
MDKARDAIRGVRWHGPAGPRAVAGPSVGEAIPVNESSFLHVSSIDQDVEDYLRAQGAVFQTFGGYDSGCTGYGLESAGQRWFVKHAWHERALSGLRRAVDIHAAVRHPALPRLRNRFAAPDGLVLVYDWAHGQGLREPGAADRFRHLAPPEAAAAVDTIFDLHAALAARGFVAVDLYDGSFLYDFDARRMYVCDLDEYRAAPFVLDMERLPGSTRFMAPEEWRRGSTIDQVTNVFTLGRVAAVLLGDHAGSAKHFRAGAAPWSIVERATRRDRSQRFQSVAEFVAAWRRAQEAC